MTVFICAKIENKKMCKGQSNTNLLKKELLILIQIKSRWSQCESPNEKPREQKNSFNLLRKKLFS